MPRGIPTYGSTAWVRNKILDNNFVLPAHEVYYSMKSGLHLMEESAKEFEEYESVKVKI